MASDRFVTWVISWFMVAVAWSAWLYPLLIRAPHRQARRPSVTLATPTRAGLLLQCLGIAAALVFGAPSEAPGGVLRIAIAAALAGVAAVMSWTSVTNLGRQFRISAGLYDDHELVRSGPFRYVRHPIYSSMLAMLVCSVLLLWTQPLWAAISLVLYIAGTEIRVRAEDGLLASRFGERFHEYRRSVSAYVPFVR